MAPTTPSPIQTISLINQTIICNDVWVQLGMDIDGEAIGDNSGESVSLSSDGNTVAIGAYLNDGNGPDSGHTRVFRWDGDKYIQIEVNGVPYNLRIYPV